MTSGSACSTRIVGRLADRSTFIGFEGVIPSSQAYCDAMPMARRQRTNVARHGQLTVRPEDSSVSLTELLRRPASVPAERAREMALIGEARRDRDLRDR
jgi:hypothetical protein